MTKYLFRMDDICPTMDQEKFNQFLDIFHEYNIKPLIGIIPDNKDPKLIVDAENSLFWLQMRSLVKDHGWEVSQHGYQHIYHTRDGGILKLNQNSETAGLKYEEQLSVLKKGQDILKRENLESKVYMAPSHSYDRNTLKALKALGFETITDGYSFYPYESDGLVFIPCQMATPRKVPFGLYTFCIHANNSSDAMIKYFAEFIKNNHQDIISFSQAGAFCGNGFIQSSLETSILSARRFIKTLRS